MKKVNVGLMGHVDSGKTSICATLSTVLSTASLDKNPQAQERGITLDLGFSCFDHEQYLFTLVDCPGHASLIRTIIGGAQIIDMVLLVIDITKGIQTQTAEGIVIAEITTDKLLVVLNKIDMIPEGERQKKITRMKSVIAKTFGTTKFGSSIQIVPYSAQPKESPQGLTELKDVMKLMADSIFSQDRMIHGKTPFLFAVDHCFPIKGQGTVLTGTLLSGSVTIGQDIHIPHLKLDKKVKSIQMFKNPVQEAVKGDRVGLLVTQFDAKLMERGYVCSHGLVSEVKAAIVEVNRIKYFKGEILTNAKFHVSVGHSNVMGVPIFFSAASDTPFSLENEYLYEEKFEIKPEITYWALITFENPIFIPRDAILIGSKLDTKITLNTCRLAFYGKILDNLYQDQLSTVKIYRTKQKLGSVDRIIDASNLIGKDMFKKETDMSVFVGLSVTLGSGQVGKIESAFGKTGKFKVYFPSGDLDKTKHGREAIKLVFKRFMFDKEKKIRQ